MESEFRPLEGRARWAMAGVIAVMVTDLVRIWADRLEMSLMNRLLDDDLDVEALADLDANDNRQFVVAVVRFGAYAGAAVLFIRWFHAAYGNLPGLGVTSLRFRRGWAIGGWFVPILNLWRPKQIANDSWRAGSLDLPKANVTSLSAQPTTPLLELWWGAPGSFRAFSTTPWVAPSGVETRSRAFDRPPDSTSSRRDSSSALAFSQSLSFTG